MEGSLTQTCVKWKGPKHNATFLSKSLLFEQGKWQYLRSCFLITLIENVFIRSTFIYFSVATFTHFTFYQALKGNVHLRKNNRISILYLLFKSQVLNFVKRKENHFIRDLLSKSAFAFIDAPSFPDGYRCLMVSCVRWGSVLSSKGKSGCVLQCSKFLNLQELKVKVPFQFSSSAGKSTVTQAVRKT